MDNEFLRFYKTLDKSKFKYFVKDDTLVVYGSDLEMIPGALLPSDAFQKGQARFASLDAVVRGCLLERGIGVEEYTRQTDGRYARSRAASPSRLGEFADVCLGASIEPTLCAVHRVRDRVEFSYVSGEMVRSTVFEDDDLHSNLYSLVSSLNCVEMLHCEPFWERLALGWGVSNFLVSGREQGESKEGSLTCRMITSYLKKELAEERFVRSDCCLVDIRDYDLVDMGTETPQGSRLLNRWLRAPSIDAVEINRRLDSVEVFGRLRIDLGGCSDLKRLIAKILTKRITVTDAIRCYEMLQKIPVFLEEFRRGVEENGWTTERNGMLECGGEGSAGKETEDGKTATKQQIVQEDFQEPLERIYGMSKEFVAKLEATVDIEEGRVLPDLTERLVQLAAERRVVYDEIESEFLRLRRILPHVKYSGRAWKIPRRDYSATEFDRNRFVVLTVAKTGVSFVTAALSRCREQLEATEAQVVVEEAAAFAPVQSILSKMTNALEIYNFIVSLMDIYRALANKARLPEYSRPVFSDASYEVEGFFHPLLENKEPIINNICFDKQTCLKGIEEECITTNKQIDPSLPTNNPTLCIITGPNMGGKSTVLKALSMISLYAQIGAYVPARRAVLPIFDRVFLRVGATDHTSAGLSTFMVEMKSLAKIIRSATRRSLILIDELGRGTAALDGLSLVIAVREHLTGLRAYTAMATHFSEAVGTDTLNLKMGVSQGRLTYKLTPGVADSSFGIGTAAMVGFPQAVVDQAKAYLAEGNATNSN